MLAYWLQRFINWLAGLSLNCKCSTLMLTIDRMSVVVDMFLLSAHYYFLVSYVTLSSRVYLKVPCFSQSHSYNTCHKKHAASET